MRNKNINLKTIIILVLAFCFFQPQTIKAQKKPTLKKQIKANLTARQIADKVLPSVVLIITLDENEKPISQGSGFIIGKGLVVSNLHVFERATNAMVKNVKTGEVSKAIEVVGMNAKEDICVIRIENTKFPALALGESDSIKTGDEIYVASNPKGLEGSFTKGIISSLRSDVGLFQIDAAISSGSSGGVLLNQKAESVGIIKSSLVSGQNLNFAIPINKLKSLPYKFKHPILLAGACAYRDKAKEKLKGLVKSLKESYPVKVSPNGSVLSTELVTIASSKKYDLFGNKIENTFYASDGKSESTYIVAYDENGLKITQEERFNNGKPQIYKISINEAISDKLSKRNFSIKEILSSDNDYQIYDSNGLLKESNTFVKELFFYDVSEQVIEMQIFSDGKILLKERYTYKTDDRNNWIAKTTYVNHSSFSDEWEINEKVFRTIEYYD